MRTQRPFEGGLNQFRPPNIPPRTAGIALAVLLGSLVVWSSVFTVAPEEVGVVLTFGKYSRQAEPGLRIKWPRPIQTVMKVPVQRQLKTEFGFRTASAGVRSQYASGSFRDESLMLTGDLNVAVVEWTTQFRVADPYKYLFRVRNLYDSRERSRADTFRAMNEAVMRAVIGDRSVNEVNQAQQEKERMINEARAQYNAVIPRAGGEALQTIQQAEGYATDRVNRALGDAELFKSLLAAYRRAPEVTRRRIYLETMEAVYPNVRQKIVLDEALQGILPLLPLTREVKP